MSASRLNKQSLARTADFGILEKMLLLESFLDLQRVVEDVDQDNLGTHLFSHCQVCSRGPEPDACSFLTPSSSSKPQDRTIQIPAFSEHRWVVV